MNYREIKKELNRIKNNPKNWEITDSEMDEGQYLTNYLGSYMYLDPCGKYHHFLSPNGIEKRCMRYWDNMERAASELQMWIEPGQGDLCDVFLCKQIETE